MGSPYGMVDSRDLRDCYDRVSWYNCACVLTYNLCTEIFLSYIIQTPRGFTSRKTDELVRLCSFYKNKNIALMVNDLIEQCL